MKFFSSRNHILPVNPNPKIDPNSNPNPNPVAEKPLIVQIIHAGGVVERYYMAFPAATIMEKYPKFVLTRPEIFRRPWDSILRPEEILVPGEKYFVVPIPTVKKLRRRMMKSTVEKPNNLVYQDKDRGQDTGRTASGKAKTKAVNRHVRFKGIESKTRCDNVDAAEDKGKKKKKMTKKKMSSNGEESRKKNVRFSPLLTIIDEP